MKLFNFKKQKKNRGFTLVEILLVVGFIAVAGLAVYVTYNKVSSSGQANTETRNLSTLQAGVKSLYGGSTNYTGITNAVLNDGRVTPDSMRPIPYTLGATAINNTFGGTVDVIATTLGGGTANNGFQITYNRVPGSVCAKLVTTGGTSFDQITVNGATVKNFGQSDLNITALTQGCAADAGTGVPIVFQSL